MTNRLIITRNSVSLTRITAKEHLANESILIHGLCLFLSFSSLGCLCPHFFAILKHHIKMSITTNPSVLISIGAEIAYKAFTRANSLRLLRQDIKICVLFLTECVRMLNGPLLNSDSSSSRSSSGVMSLSGLEKGVLGATTFWAL